MNVVQIGTCKANDDLPNYVKTNPVTKVILVEPMTVHNEDIGRKYDGTPYIIENCAIVDNGLKEISFFYNDRTAPLFQTASVSREHLLNHELKNNEDVVEIKVPCMRINDLFEKYNLKKIDYLFIDSEGLDEALIKDIDFEKYEIDKIHFESLHIGGTFANNVNPIIDYLTERGYSTQTGIGDDGWDCLSTRI